VTTLVLAPALYPPGFRMIESIDLLNFRGLSSATLRDCRRINLLVGENGSGKTALLEGVFLAAGPSPELALRLRQWRGIEPGQMFGSEEQIEEALWGDFFHNFNWKKPASVSLHGTPADHSRSVTITFNRQEQIIPVGRRGNSNLPIPQAAPIDFKWKSKGKTVVVVPEYRDGAIKIPPITGLSPIDVAFFPANHHTSAKETAGRFSELSRSFRMEEINQAFSEQFPDVSDISLEMVAGQPVLYAKVRGLREKIPLSMASSGMNKMIAILVAIAVNEGGVILIDEIESGFYYKRLPALWQNIFAFATAYNVQIFASTHSAECLEAAALVAHKNPGEFSLIRTLIEKGVSQIRHLGSDKFLAAMEEQFDLR
jgi:AAA domain, putative AbiEii toxin, Type IV TA system